MSTWLPKGKQVGQVIGASVVFLNVELDIQALCVQRIHEIVVCHKTSAVELEILSMFEVVFVD